MTQLSSLFRMISVAGVFVNQGHGVCIKRSGNEDKLHTCIHNLNMTLELCQFLFFLLVPVSLNVHVKGVHLNPCVRFIIASSRTDCLLLFYFKVTQPVDIMIMSSPLMKIYISITHMHTFKCTFVQI